MHIYFGTVVRAAPILNGGSLYKLDWENKKIVAETPISPVDPTLFHDPNARGNARGCRGILRFNDEIIAADYHSLNIYDTALKLKRKISHGLMVGLHESQLVGDSIWVTSTVIDAALKYRLSDGALEQSFWPREDEKLQTALNLEPLIINKEVDNRTNFLEESEYKGLSHLHLNAVCEFRGEVYALFHSKAVLVNLTSGEIIIQDDHLKHAHNLIIQEPGVVYINDTHRTVIRQYELDNGRQIREFNIRKMPGIKTLLLKSAALAIKEMGLSFFGEKRKATSRPLYLRGLSINDTHIFAGFSPATIVCIDKKSGELVDSYTYSLDMRVCIHGLSC